MIESGLDFTFPGEAIKFDDTSFYNTFKSYMPNGKGVDFWAYDDHEYLFMEVKNCTGFERENMKRTIVDSKGGVSNESIGDGC